MAFRDIAHKIMVRTGLTAPINIKRFSIDSAEAEVRGEAASSELERQFYAHKGRVVHKWTHYLPIYDQYFARFRGTGIRMLEVGVFKGGSLELWRDYLGPSATIFGIDINPACAEYVSPPNVVRIGSQDDRKFLKAVVAEMGGVDLVLDDGSHIGRHQWVSFETLFPLLNEGGLYIIEDLHTSYWPGFAEGGYRRSGTAIALIKRLIDDMHGNYHNRPQLEASATEWIPAIHIYDSTVVIEKQRRSPPAHIQVGAAVF